MVEWLAHAPLLLVAAAVFLALYAAAALVVVVLSLLRRRGHGDALGPLSPGLLAPMGLIFGLLVGFLVADVWADRGDASAAVVHEASALRDVDLLMGAFPAEQPRVRQLLREQIDTYVADEWPEMSGGRATLTAPPGGLAEIQRIALGLSVQSEGQRVAPTACAAPRRQRPPGDRDGLLRHRSGRPAPDPPRLTRHPGSTQPTGSARRWASFGPQVPGS